MRNLSFRLRSNLTTISVTCQDGFAMPSRTPAPVPTDRAGFRFRGDHPALDLAATLAARKKPEPRELLAEPADLDRWFEAAGIVDARPHPKSRPRDLDAARQLREAIYRIAIALLENKPAAPDDLSLLNHHSDQAIPTPHLEPGPTKRSPPRITWTEPTPPALLASIARAAILLFGSPQATRIRHCEGQGCAILFLDTSRAGGRRWCSMAGCGNKAKVAAFRERGGR
jgi:predicted RNA-binding Zn ribbon-like protein